MLIADVFSSTPPRYPFSRFTHLINELLILEYKLNQLSDHSVYFRWAQENHLERLNKLIRRYNNFRYRMPEVLSVILE